MQDTNTFNIMNGLAIFLKVCSSTKIIAHSGAIDVILTNSQYTQDELDTLVQFGWEELTDYSWRYWLEKKVSPWITLAGKYEKDEQYHQLLESIAQDRKELDEREARYYDEEYQIVEEIMYDQ